MTAVAVVVLGGAALWLFGICKGLLSLRRLVDRSWEQVDDELQLRQGLVPDLLAVVQDRARLADPAAAGIDAVVAALAGVRAADQAVSARATAERELGHALEGLFWVADQHPALCAEESYLALRRELTDINGRATAARRLYNANVARLLAGRAGFPAGILARLVGIGPADAAGALSVDPRIAGRGG